jgi:hypothetical protein
LPAAAVWGRSTALTTCSTGRAAAGLHRESRMRSCPASPSWGNGMSKSSRVSAIGATTCGRTGAPPEYFVWMARNRMNYWWAGQTGHPLLHKLGIRLLAGFHADQISFMNPLGRYPYNHPRFPRDEMKMSFVEKDVLRDFWSWPLAALAVCYLFFKPTLPRLRILALIGCFLRPPFVCSGHVQVAVSPFSGSCPRGCVVPPPRGCPKCPRPR